MSDNESQDIDLLTGSEFYQAFPSDGCVDCGHETEGDEMLCPSCLHALLTTRLTQQRDRLKQIQAESSAFVVENVVFYSPYRASVRRAELMERCERNIARFLRRLSTLGGGFTNA